MRNWRDIFEYVVIGLPACEEAWIARIHGAWRILRSTNGVQGEWAGEYETAQQALAALEKELDAHSEVHAVVQLTCPHCSQKQKVELAVKVGFAQVDRQHVRCVHCQRGFDTRVPDKIVRGPFRV
jgi:hypothetical protein